QEEVVSEAFCERRISAEYALGHRSPGAGRVSDRSRHHGRTLMAGILLEGANVSDEQRAEHARALAAKNRAESIRHAGELKASIGTQKLQSATTVEGEILSDEIIPSGGHWSREIRVGNHLRIIDLEGRQAEDPVDLVLRMLVHKFEKATPVRFAH